MPECDCRSCATFTTQFMIIFDHIFDMVVVGWLVYKVDHKCTLKLNKGLAS